MVDVGRVVRHLRAAGAEAEFSESGLTLNGTPVHLQSMGRRPATPSDLTRIAEDGGMRKRSTPSRSVIVADRASSQTAAWLHEHPEITLILHDRVFLDGTVHLLDDPPPPQPTPKGPRPYARFAIARVLLSGAPRNNQVHLAELAGVTQGSVSNALQRIPDIEDPGAVFDDLVRDYPGPGGQTYHWWSASPLHEQAGLVSDHGALISGDFAADRLAAWRTPERVIGYVDRPVDLSAAGYVLSAPDDYTTMLVVSADPTLRATGATWNLGGDVADPIIAAHDVRRTATTGDDDEAVEKLRELVVRRYTEAKHG